MRKVLEVKVNTTLSDEKRRIYLKGSIYTDPIPEPLLAELESGSGHVTALVVDDDFEPDSNVLEEEEIEEEETPPPAKVKLKPKKSLVKPKK